MHISLFRASLVIIIAIFIHPYSLLNVIAHQTQPVRRREDEHHFFPKNDMMFPCPALAVDFLPFAVEGAATLGFGAGASSSEKDSQTGSSFVTVSRQYREARNCGENGSRTYPNNLPNP